MKAFSRLGARPARLGHAMTLGTVGMRVGDEIQIAESHPRIS